MTNEWRVSEYMKFQQFTVGQMFKTNPYVVTREDIIQFAERYDPHGYHINDNQAKQSIFGTLVASGMHTMSIINAEWVKLGVLGEDMLGGLGIEAKWLHPVHPGDTIYADVEVHQKRELDDLKGIITFQFTGYNQHHTVWAKVRIKTIVAAEVNPIQKKTSQITG